MSSQGSGSSRRSHTKSRKGCKTCKRRHIRCDEMYPQCRNCTKHHVRCDYMESASAEDALGSSQSAGFVGSPDAEVAISEWQRTGIACVDGISIDLNDQQFEFSTNDMRLLYYILRAGQSSESKEYTIWTNTFSQGLAAAQEHPFLMHAGFAFTAFSLAFETGSVDAKGLAYHYGGVALRGLHHAISNFSQENADAVLLASRLLAWQANDWNSWASLTAGIRTVVNTMLEFKNESSIPDVIDQENTNVPLQFPTTQRPPVTDEFYSNYVATLQQCITACDTLLSYLAGRDQDLRFIEQLKDYIRRLLGVRPAYTPQEQFSHLYALRKWLFYVPVVSLRSPRKDLMTLVVIGQYYAVALQMDALFPNVARAFCSGISETPLSEIIKTMERQYAANPSNETLRTQSSLLAFHRQALANYQTRKQELTNPALSGVAEPGFEGFREQLAFSIEGQGIGAQRSPGFGPLQQRQDLSRASSVQSGMYLEVPSASGQAYAGGAPTVGLPWSLEPEEMSYDEMSTEMPSGFVHHPHSSSYPSGSPPLWT